MYNEGIHEIVQMAYDDPPVPEMFPKILVRHIVKNLFNFSRTHILQFPNFAELSRVLGKGFKTNNTKSRPVVISE